MILRKTVVYFFMTFLLTLLSGGQLNAQERLDGLSSNPALKGKVLVEDQQRQRMLSLPFFDDFYPVDVFPDQALWEDDLIYINATFPIEPPTIGVATFDGLNANGDPYSILSDDYGIADLLTSMPIDLSGIDSSESVYLSFYFQPGGLGEAPDYELGDLQNQDQLLLEFQDTAGSWDTVWVQHGDTLQAFEQVFVPVDQNRYLFEGFQFRFKSIGRLTGAFDHWHIDYVRLDKNRDPDVEINIAEMAYQYWPTSLLTPYYAMPYNQFDSSYIDSTHSVYIRNNFNQITTDIIDFYRATEVSTATVLDNFAGASRDLGPLLSIVEEYNSFSIPEDVIEDTVTIRVDYSFLVSAEDTSNQVSSRNNRVIKDQVFNNYFSYDDGSAEMAYILEVRTNDALFGQVGLEYFAPQEDTLRAVKMNFNHFNSDVGNVNFSLIIWKTLATDSTDEEILYRQDFIRVDNLLTGDTIGMVNGFTYVPVDPEFIVSEEAHLLVEGQFYVGFEIAVNVVLPLGFDLNTNGSAFHFINLGQGWSPTQFDGSLMMNPVLGAELSEEYVVSGNETVLQSLGFKLYPNPVVEQLRIESEVANGYWEVIDLVGRTIMESHFSMADGINARALNPGVYILRITDKDKGITGSSRFVRP